MLLRNFKRRITRRNDKEQLKQVLEQVFLAACGSGDVETMKTLFDSGATISCQNKEKQTPAHIACSNNQPGILNALIKWE